MQLEHAILILFSTIWPLAGLKYDSINYCQESPGAKPFSRRMFRGAPGFITGLFASRAVGFGGTWLSPTPAPILAPRGRVSAVLLPWHQFWCLLGFFLAFSAFRWLARGSRGRRLPPLAAHL